MAVSAAGGAAEQLETESLEQTEQQGAPESNVMEEKQPPRSSSSSSSSKVRGGATAYSLRNYTL